MAVSATTTLHDSTAALLDEVATALGRSREAIIEEAVREHASEQAQFLEMIAVGERDIDEGRLHSHEQMTAWLSERMAAAEDRLGRAQKS